MAEPSKQKKPSKPKNISWEKYTALSSMLVAACALMISLWQGYSMQQHNKLSLRPYLETELNYNEDGSWDLYINNNGVGPAEVTEVRWFADGEEYGDHRSFLHALGEDSGCYAIGGITRFYKVSDQQIVYRTLGESCFKTLDEFQALLARLAIVVEYQSLYGEPYQLQIRAQ